ncbi:hypothetical protein [Caulobacter sp. 1776]|uniref:hypothetical protein n=1 Tax=Caulobacter sp. 1776 TaxID=3156420 RepID=UPI003399BFF0
MKRIIGPMAGLVLTVCLSACAGLAADPVTLAQAVRVLNEGCERTVDLNLDRSQPGGGSLKVTRVCAPPVEAQAAPKP